MTASSKELNLLASGRDSPIGSYVAHRKAIDPFSPFGRRHIERHAHDSASLHGAVAVILVGPLNRIEDFVEHLP